MDKDFEADLRRGNSKKRNVFNIHEHFFNLPQRKSCPKALSTTQVGKFWAFIFLVALGLSSCAPSRPGSDLPWWRSSETSQISRFSSLSRTSQYLPMRDGIRIAADLYLPTALPAAEKIPAILIQTRYYRALDLRFSGVETAGRFKSILDTFGLNGYAVVITDTRGSGASFGSIDSPWSPEEVRDGNDITQWIISQPWSNGRVGTTGVSYDGTAAEMLVATGHPAIGAAAPRFALFDCYTDIAFPGGIHLKWFTKNWSDGNWALDNGYPSRIFGFFSGLFLRGVAPVDTDSNRSLLKAAIAEHENNHDLFQDMVRITYRDEQAQRGYAFADVCPFGYIRELQNTKVPLYSMSGWFDGAYANSAVKRFMTIKNPGSKLILGPWDHGATQNISNFSSGRKPSFSQTADLKRFFDLHLKGEKSAIKDEPSVHYFTMGEEKWKAANTWPPPGAKKANVFLSENSSLSYRPPTSKDGADKYIVDYSAGTGSHSRWNSLYNRSRQTIEYPDRAREDGKLLVYDSPPLSEPIEVTGNPIANIYAASTDRDGEFFVYLEDVWPDGSVHYVTEGELRALHRKESRDPPIYEFPGVNRSYSPEDAETLKPGTVVELRFELIVTSYQFQAGHKIRVAIAGADKDHFAFIPKDPPTILMQRNTRYPSRVELPVYGLK